MHKNYGFLLSYVGIILQEESYYLGTGLVRWLGDWFYHPLTSVQVPLMCWFWTMLTFDYFITGGIRTTSRSHNEQLTFILPNWNLTISIFNFNEFVKEHDDHSIHYLMNNSISIWVNFIRDSPSHMNLDNLFHIKIVFNCTTVYFGPHKTSTCYIDVKLSISPDYNFNSIKWCNLIISRLVVTIKKQIYGH